MTRPARWLVALFAIIAARALAQTRPAGPAPPAKLAGLAGVIRDSLGHPIRLATLFVDGSSRTATSDDSGQFVLRGLSPGRNGFTITRIGYAPVSFETSLLPDSIIVLSIHMRSVQMLNTVKVTAERINAYLARTGFVDRRKMGLGSYLSPEHLDSISAGVFQPSALLEGVRGIDLRCGTGCKVLPHSALTSCLWLFVDGVSSGTVVQIDSLGLTPAGVAAIEVYDRPSIVPMEFQGALPQKTGRSFSTTGGCGAVAIWTKTRVP